MKFLEKFGFEKESILQFKESTSDVMIVTLVENKKLVQTNLKYLMDLGVTNIVEIFKSYYEIFLIDHSNFINIFNKYDKEDLVEKLEKNIAIIEYL